MPRSKRHVTRTSATSQAAADGGDGEAERSASPMAKRRRTAAKPTGGRSEAEALKAQWVGPCIGREEGAKLYGAFDLDGETYELGDCVALKAGTKQQARSDLDCWIARIASLWEDDDGQWMKGQWFYFPEEVPGGRQPAHHLYEVFPTSHADTNTLDTISGKVSVLSEEDWRMQAQGPGGDSATDESGRPCFFARWLFDPPTRLFRSLPTPWTAATWTGAEADDTHGAAADDIGAGASPLTARTKRRSGASRAAAGSAGGSGTTTTPPAIVSSASTTEGGASPSVDKLAQACLQLQLSSVPRSLPCREEERATIMEFLTSSIRSGGAGSALYLSGMPGTGKTATVMEVVRELRQRAHAGHLRPFSFVNINAMRLTHPYQLYTQVYKALTGEHAAASRAAQLLEERFSSRENVGVSVLLVDEIDFLVTRKQSVLYNIFEWPTRRNARLVVIGIANTMDLPERLLPRVHSRLGLKRIVFTPYTRDQIVDIVRARLEGLDAFAEDAVDMAARKVASLSGDVRRALQICRRAAELARRRVAEKGTAATAVADGDNERVTLRDVNAAARELSTTHALEAIMHGSLWEKLFLVALALLVRQFGAEEVSLRHVASRFAALAQTHLKEKPTSQEAREVADRLGELRLVLVAPDRNDRWPTVRLNVQHDDVGFALRDDTLLSRLVETSL